MHKRLIAILIITIFACQLFAFILDVSAQAVTQNAPKKQSNFSKWWENFMKRTYLFPLVMGLIATTIGIIVATVKKDKLLKSLSGQLITIEQIDNARARGRLRVETSGIEVIAEKANEGSNEKVSYILRESEYNKIHALVRYFDLLTEKEKHHRNDELKKAYHPSILIRLRRRIRNIINQIKRVITDAFNILFSRRFAGKLGGGQYEKEIQESGKQAVESVTGAEYDSLIDRLIGTRVIIKAGDKEYVGVFKDYTSKFVELLDVDYRNDWAIKTNRDEAYVKHDRGISIYRNGNNMVLSSKSPFDIILKYINWTEGPQNVDLGNNDTVLAVIPPFGQIEFNVTTPYFDKVIAPFEILQLPVQYTPTNYKFIQFNFKSIRKADIVLMKDYGILRHRTEKYEPRLLDINSITESLLTTKEEGFILKGTTTQMTVHNGYITNMPRERMDIHEIDDQISQRWAVDTYFSTLDKKMRPVFKFRFLGPFPMRKTKKLIALFGLMSIINSDENRKHDPLLPFIYQIICNVNMKKRLRFRKKKQVKAKKPNRLLEFLRKPFHVQPQKA
ncbi:MAG: hypothetical protein QG588_912 [Candidatus Poribacteria bacterium]|nr:hypothetical protein [Candidatus Poribacteria bacterium]